MGNMLLLTPIFQTERGGEMRYVFRLAFFSVLGASILAVSILESKYIEKTFQKFEKNLLEYAAMLDMDEENINSFENMQRIECLTQEWHKTATKLKYLVWHTGIKDVEIGLSRIATYTQENDYTEAKTELNNLLDFTRHYSKDFKVLPENVF